MLQKYPPLCEMLQKSHPCWPLYARCDRRKTTNRRLVPRVDRTFGIVETETCRTTKTDPKQMRRGRKWYNVYQYKNGDIFYRQIQNPHLRNKNAHNPPPNYSKQHEGIQPRTEENSF
jgi:hypothetical protein